jgi:hypothetical protein
MATSMAGWNFPKNGTELCYLCRQADAGGVIGLKELGRALKVDAVPSFYYFMGTTVWKPLQYLRLPSRKLSTLLLIGKSGETVG